MAEKFVDIYVTVAEANGHLSTDAFWILASNEEKERALVEAGRTIDNHQFLGTSTSEDQLMAWPRSGVVYFSTRLNRIIQLADNELPREVFLAVCELARFYLRFPEWTTGSQEGPSSIKLGPLEIDDRPTGSRIDSRFVSTPDVKYLHFLKPLLLQGTRTNHWWRAN